MGCVCVCACAFLYKNKTNIRILDESNTHLNGDHDNRLEGTEKKLVGNGQV